MKDLFPRLVQSSSNQRRQFVASVRLSEHKSRALVPPREGSTQAWSACHTPWDRCYTEGGNRKSISENAFDTCFINLHFCVFLQILSCEDFPPKPVESTSSFLNTSLNSLRAKSQLITITFKIADALYSPNLFWVNVYWRNLRSNSLYHTLCLIH